MPLSSPRDKSQHIAIEALAGVVGGRWIDRRSSVPERTKARKTGVLLTKV